MKTIQSPLENIHPVVKIYVFLFVILFTSFFGSLRILGITTSIVFIVFVLSRIPLRLMWNNIKLYLILLVPFILLFSWFEYQNYHAFYIAALTYLRFVNVLIIGVIFGLTTNSIDIALLCLKHKLTKIGIALAGGLASFVILDRKIKNIMLLQQLRGVRLSSNPFKIKDTITALQSLLIASVLQTIELSQDFATAMIARGFITQKITAPPHFRFNKVNILLTVGGTLFLVVTLIESLK